MRARNRDGEESDLVSLDELARFDAAARTWSDLPPMPGRRSSHAAAMIGSTLYVVGGWDIAGPMGRASTFHGETWALDLAAEDAAWRRLATPFQRRALAVAALDGALVALGGMDEHGETQSDVHVLDAATGTWGRGPDLPERGFGVAAVGSQGRVWAAGARGTLWSWAPGEEAWRAEGRQYFGRLFGQLVARAEGDLLCVGGTSSGTQVRAVERLRPRPQVDAQTGTAIEAAAPAVAPFRVAARLRLASPARSRNRQAAELVGDRLLLFGGNSSLGQHDFAPQNFLDEGWALDLRSLEWERVRELPVRRQSLQTAQLAEGALIAVGGFGHDGLRTRSFADAWRYSSAADVWKALPPLPQGRTQFALLGDERELWILGGLDYVEGRAKGADFEHATALWRSDATAEEPRFEPAGIELPAGRRAFGSAVIGRTAFLVGGLADGFERVEECLEFDLDARTFREFPAPRAPRIGPELVAQGGKLYLIGGASARGGDGTGSDRSIEVYDPGTRTWSLWTEDCGIEPAHLRAFVHNGRILLASTQFPDPAALELVWLDPAAAPLD
jgi:N-acetylneuraminic acid mutarotase